ncbi:hypothetical protein [Poseidonocella sp. HB161398]|uniref:hypothetical protein n=1 Tax=Poseidonocella sp. HB161398 TaxID=2320855 RepID=UPI001107B259|nr:hypothetical protein [Poseidonocella sp. HB161398]
MFSPGPRQAALSLAGAYSQLLAASSFASAMARLRLHSFAPEPAWLAPLQAQLLALAAEARHWEEARPAIQAALLGPVMEQAAAADRAAAAPCDPAAIRKLRERARAGGAELGSAAAGLAGHLARLRAAQEGYEAALGAAWRELAAEEAAMSALAARVAQLLERLAALHERPRHAILAADQLYVLEPVSLDFGLIDADGKEVPVLSMVLDLGAGRGKPAPVPQEDAAAARLLQEIAAQRAGMSPEAQAAALCTAVVRLTDMFDREVSGPGDRFPYLAQMWRSEAERHRGTEKTLRSGVPVEELPGLASLRQDAAEWGLLAALARCCQRFPGLRSSQTVPRHLRFRSPRVAAAMPA